MVWNALSVAIINWCFHLCLLPCFATMYAEAHGKGSVKTLPWRLVVPLSYLITGDSTGFEDRDVYCNSSTGPNNRTVLASQFFFTQAVNPVWVTRSRKWLCSRRGNYSGGISGSFLRPSRPFRSAEPTLNINSRPHVPLMSTDWACMTFTTHTHTHGVFFGRTHSRTHSPGPPGKLAL